MFKDRIKINSNKIKTVIFDFDGVIVDSVNIKTDAFRELFSEYSNDIVNKIGEHHLQNGGMSRFEKISFYFQEFINEELSKDRLELLCTKFSEIVFQKVVKCDFIQGSIEFIENNYSKFRFFIVSGTPQGELIKIVQERKIDKYFIEVLGSPQSKEKNIEILINKYGLEIKEVLFIGDSINDFKAAVENDILFVSV